VRRVHLRLAQVRLLADANSGERGFAQSPELHRPRQWRRTRQHYLPRMEKSNVATQGDWQANFDRCAALGTSNWRASVIGACRRAWRWLRLSMLPAETRACFHIHHNGGSFATGSYWYETIMGINNANLAWTYAATAYQQRDAADHCNSSLALRPGQWHRGSPNVLAVQPANHYTIIGAAPPAKCKTTTPVSSGNKVSHRQLSHLQMLLPTARA